ncbi:unnamed protein product [Alopecurus aequalis]
MDYRVNMRCMLSNQLSILSIAVHLIIDLFFINSSTSLTTTPVPNHKYPNISEYHPVGLRLPLLFGSLTPMGLYTYLLFCSAITLLLVSPCAGLGLDTVRDFLTREEDTIVFSLIERAKHPLNLPAYQDHAWYGPDGRGRNGSFVELFVRESEEIQAKAGRYESQLEIPFFHAIVPITLAPRYNFTTDLYPAAASVNVNDDIWGIYFNELLPLLAKNDDDGNYAVTAASDLACLQALSRRINYGRYVAEVKFRGDQQRYTTLISSKVLNRSLHHKYLNRSGPSVISEFVFSGQGCSSQTVDI